MKILDYSWDLATSIAGRDHETMKLILDQSLASPALAADRKGIVLKVPLPAIDERGFYRLHGLYFDPDDQSIPGMWRLFRASLYHVSLHAGYSDFGQYAGWARGRDLTPATAVVSMIEDFRITKRALSAWPGLLPDLAYANYISALRVKKVGGLPPPERFATKLLLSLWGVGAHEVTDDADDTEVRDVAATIRSAVDADALEGGGVGKGVLSAAQKAYSALAAKGRLREVPFFPYTESHGDSTIFDRQIVETEDPKTLEQSALSVLGLNLPSLETDRSTVDEAAEFTQSMRDSESRLNKIREGYSDMLANTRLEGIEFPSGDYASYLRVKSSLAGPIRNIRDQLRQVKNVLDETQGHESGQVDMQAAMQVIASESVRTDVFIQEELMHKNEAWAILVDASKSTSPFSREVRGIATCLAEVASGLMTAPHQWALYTFNSSLQVIKDFDEEFATENKARLGGLAQKSTTLLPDALKFANKALSDLPVDIRILVVASDGHPTGYKGIERSLLDAVKQVNKSGTFLMGLGIDSHAIEEYFTVNCVLSSPYQMMKSFVRSYLELSSMF